MKELDLAKKKIALVQTILQLKNADKIDEIQRFVDGLLKLKYNSVVKDENKTSASYLTFDEWNMQFDDLDKLEEFVPEYGMKLRDFRMEIYKSEMSEGMSKEEFFKKVKSWK